MRAAEAFNCEVGARFSTYAAFWIRQSNRSALGRLGLSLLRYMWTLSAEWHRVTDALRREHGRDPCENEVADRLSLSAKRTRAVRKALRVRSSGQRPDDPDGNTALDLITDGSEVELADALAGAEQVGAVVQSLTTLSEREATVIRLRFGLDDTEPLTLGRWANDSSARMSGSARSSAGRSPNSISRRRLDPLGSLRMDCRLVTRTSNN